MEDGVDGGLLLHSNRKLRQIYRASCSARISVALVCVYHMQRVQVWLQCKTTSSHSSIFF